MFTLTIKAVFDELKRQQLLKNLITLKVGRDIDGTPITQLTNKELATLIAITKIKKGTN